MSHQVFTDEEYAIGAQNGVTRQNMCRRLRRGWKYEDCYTVPVTKVRQTRLKENENLNGKTLCGQFVSHEQLNTAEDNGIAYNTLWTRLEKGMDLATAISQPVGRRQKVKDNLPSEFDAPEIKEIVSRIKALNQHEMKSFPVMIPKPIKVKMDQLGIKFEDIKPMTKS
ncbi:hypothetical protein [Salinicoccus sp. Marseille-QA3877]